MPIRRRRRNKPLRRKKETRARAHLYQIAADVYEDGDTEDSLRAKMVERIEEEEDRPFLRLLMKLLEMLLPLLLKGLAGA